MAINKQCLEAAITKWKSFTGNDRAYGLEECFEKAIEAYEAERVAVMTKQSDGDTRCSDCPSRFGFTGPATLPA